MLKRKPRRGMLVILANAWSLMDLGVKIVFSTWSGSLAHEEIPQPLTGFYWVCNNWRASGCQPEVSPLLLGSSWLIHVFMEKGMMKMFATFKIFNYYKNWQITSNQACEKINFGIGERKDIFLCKYHIIFICYFTSWKKIRNFQIVYNNIWCVQDV